MRLMLVMLVLVLALGFYGAWRVKLHCGVYHEWSFGAVWCARR